MTTQSMTRRLDRLAGGLDSENLLEILDAAGERARAWHAAGNEGPMPFEPAEQLPANAGRAHRELHDKLAAARERVLAARARS